MIIFLYGEDSFRSQEKLAAIKAKFLEKNNSGSGLSLFDFEEKIQKIKWSSLIVARDLFSPKRLIVIKNLISAAGAEIQKEGLDFLASKKEITEDKDTIIVFWEAGLSKGNSSLFKFLKLNSKHQEFENLNSHKLAGWISEKIKKNKADLGISSRAVDKLIAYVGNDLFQMENEIIKLASFKESGIIEEEDVDLLVKAKIDSNIFETLDAVSMGNKKRALKLLQKQLKKGDDPFYILSMYVYQFRNLLKIGEFFWKGISNQYEAAKLTKLHPFVVQKGMAQLRNYDENKLKEIYKKLQDIDVSSKTGKIDIKLALDKFVAEI